MVEEGVDQQKAEPKEVEIIDPKQKKALEELVEKTITLRLQKDYRATVVHREEKGGIDDSEAALIHINEEQRDELDNPVEIDYKGTIDGYDAWLFQEMRYGRALMKLKKWRYFEEVVRDPKNPGEFMIRQVPVDLAQIFMLAKSRLNMAKGGSQSWKHIQERRANSGQHPEDSLMSRAASWSGLKREKVPRQEMNEAYGNNQK
jgi:hypothetical protein